MRFWAAVRFFFVVLTAWSGGALPASSETRHIVMLFDERPELPGLARIDAEFTNTLVAGSEDRFEIYRESMDLSRFAANDRETVLVNALRAKYAKKKIDAVVALFPDALNFLLRHRDEIFPGVPTVFCGLDRAQLGERALPPSVRGVLIKREFAPTLHIALHVHPDTEHVFVVSGVS
jgi:hypothetical protein